MLYYDIYSKVFRDNENNTYFLNVKTYNGRFSVNLLNFMPCTKKQFSMLLDIVSEDIENENEHVPSLNSFLCECIDILEENRENVHDTTQKAKYNTLLKKYNAFYNELAARYNLEIKTDPENVKYKSVFVYALHVDGAKRFSGFSFEKYGKTFHVYKNDHKQWNVIVPDTGLKLTGDSTKQKAVLLITPHIMDRLNELTGTEKYNAFRKQFYDAMTAAGFDYVLEDNSIYNYHNEPETVMELSTDSKELPFPPTAISTDNYTSYMAINPENGAKTPLQCNGNENYVYTVINGDIYSTCSYKEHKNLYTLEIVPARPPEAVTTSNRKENALKRHLYAAMLLFCYNGHITPHNAKTPLYSRTITAYTTTPYNGRKESYNRHIGKYSTTMLKRLKTAYNELYNALPLAIRTTSNNGYIAGSVAAGRYTIIVPAGYSSIPWNTSTATPLYNDSS